MVNFNQAFKLKVVTDYLNGNGSTSLCRKYHIAKSATVLKWVNRYQSYGLEGLSIQKPNIKTYSFDFRMQVLNFQKRHQLSYPKTALYFNIPTASTVYNWQKQWELHGESGLKSNSGRPKNKMKPQNPHYFIKYHYEKIKHHTSSTIKAATELIQQLPEYSTRFILHTIGLAKSVYYYHLNQDKQKDEQLLNHIKLIKQAHPDYGYRRLTFTLKNEGVDVNHKRVQRIMQCNHLQVTTYGKKKRRYNSYRGQIGKIAKNHLKRQFDTSKPYQKLVTDVSEFRYGKADIKHRVYLSPILDLYSREVLDYEISSHPTVKFTLKPVQRLIKRLPKTGVKPILHSDQGFQYQTPIWQKTLKDNAISQSMSRKGNCLDNAAMESFFHIMKAEVMTTHYQTKTELVDAMKKWIHYYNNKRIKLKLGGKSPVQYRKLTTQFN
ncbi:IS3 family transposase ISLsa2 [Apilactobacillus kunkeei]|uniref:IS3 family transposase n=1 Tax=Apilactobacillus kunkeei TaxID=148814 RepID=UPI00200B214A|nr:IS3 family transposase [Apilactobacillus kunkeei]MCK8628533.1 IS3 family transposase [Apilactobacillus kunkeei]CAI2689458.1 IS3 family transposase ISLsa2 [Apilactobacillus kunkeei]CAI2690662.1 IS3 family transposase ISLsa2 [Apilactobacillus kunkeei]